MHLHRLKLPRFRNLQDFEIRFTDQVDDAGVPGGQRRFNSHAVKRIKEMVAYAAEFSSVGEACLRKKGPDALAAQVFAAAPANEVT